MPRIVKNQRHDEDAAAATCAFCGRRVSATLLTQHHLLPKERGGKPEHRQPFCKPCHKPAHRPLAATR